MCSPGATLKYERMVSASTRRLPSTMMADALALVSEGSANAEPDATPNATARSMPATTSPRLTRTHIFMRYAPLFPTWPPPTGGSSQSPQLTPQSRDKLSHPEIGAGARPGPRVPQPLPQNGCPLGRRQMNDVIKSCKYHQHKNNRETDAKTHFLRPFRQRTPANALDNIEQKVTAIEQRDREQVKKPDRYREDGGKLDERNKTETRNLPRHLRDADRAALLVGRFATGDDAAYVTQRAVDDRPGLLNAQPNRFERCNRVKFQILRRHRTADAENSHALHVAEIVLDFLERRRRPQDLLHPVPIDCDLKRFSGARAHETLHLGEIVDAMPVDGEDKITGHESGLFRRTARLNRINSRAHRLLAVDHENHGKDHDGQEKIRQRPGDDDGRTFGYRLEHETFSAFLRIHAGSLRRVGHTCRIFIAKKLHEAAQRNGRDLPARPVAIIEANDFRTKADGEDQNPHPAPAGDEKMAKLVEEHDQAQDEQERNEIAHDAAAECVQMRQKIGPHDAYPHP